MQGLEPTEHQIQNAILNYFGMLIDAFVWRNNSGAATQTNKSGKSYFVRYGLKGSADIIGCYKGRFVAIEVKSRKGKVSPEQEYFINQINACGGYAIVARSIEDAQALVARINKDLSNN